MGKYEVLVDYGGQPFMKFIDLKFWKVKSKFGFVRMIWKFNGFHGRHFLFWIKKDEKFLAKIIKYVGAVSLQYSILGAMVAFIKDIKHVVDPLLPQDWRPLWMLK